ncbi:Kazal-type serine protease inhibitor [Bacteriovorax sp. Seq25_V]|uniref:Kazal-type serine protease inhibitor family protein n=1 Tax=Bacteriovorax sp. Seq25_V TaxID=1201288 RepID=UPI00038A3E43|nr:Kazal-type serine protease inhibitor [Bacteriovorax sp. Seq25_V]EQC43978.1 Kazal-type serine protease inhibitor domain protein [Bacteriovorax sp. Seq25_V]
MKRLVGIFTFLILITSCGEDPFKAKTASPSKNAALTSVKSTTESSSEGCICPMNYEPVCAGGKTYSNICMAQCEGKTFEYSGECSN